MYLRRPPAALFLVMAILFAGLLAGCGGGDQQSGNKEQGDDASGGAKKQAANKQASEPKIALGTIKSVKIDRRRIVLKPSSEEQGEKPIPFKTVRDATITLDNEKVELADIKEGQQAQITYVVRNERNMAREVSLISNGGAGSGGGEETG
jgi:hypothetical protein